jgi:hypothetical protein
MDGKQTDRMNRIYGTKSFGPSLWAMKSSVNVAPDGLM